MTDKEIEKHKKRIDGMSQREMAILWRFEPSKHEYLDTTSLLTEYFKKRFKELGGFTPAISKSIGW